MLIGNVREFPDMLPSFQGCHTVLKMTIAQRTAYKLVSTPDVTTKDVTAYNAFHHR